MKERYDIEWWSHDHKEMKHELEIMVIKHLVMDKEKSNQGKGVTIGFFLSRSQMSREVIDRV